MVILFMQYLIIFLISMVPLIELRGAIPYAIGFKLPLLPSYIICILGNMLPVPFIFLFARKILVWGSVKKYIGGFFNWCLKKGEKGGKKLQEKAGRGLYVALFLFVGIPLPGTGAWTGTLAASLLDMDFKKSTLAVMCGVVLAGIIMGLVSGGVFSFIRYFVTLAILKIFGFADFLRKSLHPHILAGPKLKILVVQARSDL